MGQLTDKWYLPLSIQPLAHAHGRTLGTYCSQFAITALRIMAVFLLQYCREELFPALPEIALAQIIAGMACTQTHGSVAS